VPKKALIQEATERAAENGEAPSTKKTILT